jgi:hypothetical protein
MGLFLLLQTVVEVFQGELTVVSGRNLVKVGPLSDRDDTQRTYELKTLVGSESSIPASGNLLAVDIPRYVGGPG